MSPTSQCVTRVEETVEVGEYDGVTVADTVAVVVSAELGVSVDTEEPVVLDDVDAAAVAVLETDAVLDDELVTEEENVGTGLLVSVGEVEPVADDDAVADRDEVAAPLLVSDDVETEVAELEAAVVPVVEGGRDGDPLIVNELVQEPVDVAGGVLLPVATAEEVSVRAAVLEAVFAELEVDEFVAAGERVTEAVPVATGVTELVNVLSGVPAGEPLTLDVELGDPIGDGEADAVPDGVEDRGSHSLPTVKLYPQTYGTSNVKRYVQSNWEPVVVPV